MTTAPNHLTPDVAAVWVELYDELGERGPALKGPAFDAYCGQVTRLRDAQRRIHVEGLIVPDSKNQPVAHPAFAIEKQAQDEIRKWGDKFNRRGRP